ncbi:hypothetical protein, partial [Thermogutta sp.]|uniref:hypothetical protein n=1 Tax=Thermogutta sp. TaxID=1962930 RepID=UPI0025DBF4DE
ILPTTRWQAMGFTRNKLARWRLRPVNSFASPSRYLSQRLCLLDVTSFLLSFSSVPASDNQMYVAWR